MSSPDDRSPTVAALARRAVHRSLQFVPQDAVDAVHDRWITPEGERRPLWRPLAAVLSHRPLDRAAITVPGGNGERLAAVGARWERKLWWYGEREPSLSRWWRALCAQADDVLEIGADAGYLTVVGAGAVAQGRYTAVEANPSAAAVVRRNLELNGLGRTELVEAAVVVDGSHEVDMYGSTAVRVRTVPAAVLFADRDLVRLDVEGSDATVLLAAMDQIRRNRPILVLRVRAGAAGLHAVVRDLAAEGFLIRTVAEELRAASLSEMLVAGDRDVLLVPAERRLPSSGTAS